MLRINPNQPIPADLSGYRYLILDATRGNLVAGLKATYPQLKVFGYKNASFLIDYSLDPITGNAGVPWGDATGHENWFLHDSSGNRVHSVGYTQAWFADVGLGAYQQRWLSRVLAFLASAPWDGVFMDDTNADDGWHLGGNYSLLSLYPTRAAYRAAMRSMLAAVGPAIKAAGYEVIPNIGASWDQPDVWADWATLSSGAMSEHFLKWGESTEPVLTGGEWAIHTNIERAVVGAGREFIALTYGPSSYTSAQIYVRCSFLLFANSGSASIWAPDGGIPSRTDLGAPTSAASESNGIWRRTFERGSITVDTNTGTATVN